MVNVLCQIIWIDWWWWIVNLKWSKTCCSLIYLSHSFLQDPVLNVRLKFCTVLPTLKSVLKLSDRLLLQQLEQCVRKLLSSEQEPDVSSAVRDVSIYRFYFHTMAQTVNSRRSRTYLQQKKHFLCVWGLYLCFIMLLFAGCNETWQNRNCNGYSE